MVVVVLVSSLESRVPFGALEIRYPKDKINRTFGQARTDKDGQYSFTLSWLGPRSSFASYGRYDNHYYPVDASVASTKQILHSQKLSRLIIQVFAPSIGASKSNERATTADGKHPCLQWEKKNRSLMAF